jgi:hypothetical protein
VPPLNTWPSRIFVKLGLVDPKDHLKHLFIELCRHAGSKSLWILAQKPADRCVITSYPLRCSSQGAAPKAVHDAGERSTIYDLMQGTTPSRAASPARHRTTISAFVTPPFAFVQEHWEFPP